MAATQTDDRSTPPSIDPTRPSMARVYDAWLGGKDNFAVDRAVGDRVLEIAPWVVDGVRASRGFLVDAVSQLSAAGVDQFLDLGSGLPTSPNVHDVALDLNPDAQVVYVDNDPIVIAHARARMAPEGDAPGLRGITSRVHVLDCDLLYPAEVVHDVEHAGWIDFDRPVGLLMVAVLHFVTDNVLARQVITAYSRRLAPGSHVVISVTSAEHDETGTATRAAAEAYAATTAQFRVRTRAETEALFDGVELLEPGVRQLGWDGHPVTVLAGIGRC